MVINIQAKPHSRRSVNVMNEYPKNNNCNVKSMSRPVQSCPSLFEMCDKVKEQIDFESFAKPLPNGRMHIDPLFEDICLAMADALVRPPESIMRINRVETKAGLVQEVYRTLTHEHIELVYNKFKKQNRSIEKTIAYLQTCLYNVRIGFNAHYTNLVAQDWH